ncbi:hypothetical protein, partial [Arsenophonus nasoniae]|uniref:hypothetical protein n=1 Tax=Arsenophonus nasoniae TaxID=638 RepID=UPI0005543F03
HRAEYKRREGNCLEIERLCRDAHAKGVLMFSKICQVYETDKHVLGIYQLKISSIQKLFIAILILIMKPNIQLSLFLIILFVI